MDQNEIKKILYKDNPTATLMVVRKGKLHYKATIKVLNTGIMVDQLIFFDVPVEDIGEADFLPEMPAKLLIRYLK